MPHTHSGRFAFRNTHRSLAVLTVLVSAIGAAACDSQQTPNDPKTSSVTVPTVSVRLSADAQAEPMVQRCLANPLGVVARYGDNEAYAAVDPRNPDRVIAVWQTISGSGSVVQWARSVDGGRSWTPPRAAPINACAGGPRADATRASDPWVAFGPDDRAYISAIAWTPNAGDGPDLVSALIVVASRDGGATWDAPVAAAVAPKPEVAHDNLAITADPTRPGTVYAATTRAESVDGSYFGRLGFTRSDDGGRTWSPIRPITAAVNGERIGAPQIVADPRSGRLYAVYHRSRRGTQSAIGVMVSTDRGDTWSIETVATPHVLGEQARDPVTTRPFVLATDIIQAVVSPTTGHLMIAYADARRDPGNRGDVSLVWSADGTRWSAPIAVSDTGRETAWLPAIAVSATDVAVSYVAADFTPGQRAVTARVKVRRFGTSAGGLTPLDHVVVDEGLLDWPGDYQGLVAVSGGYLGVYGRESDIVATGR